MLSPVSLALLVVSSFLAGLVDAVAGGGGLITLPALVAVGLPPHIALGTNKGQSFFGALASAASFWKKGGIDRHRVPLSFAAALVGSFLGAAALLAVRPEPLKPLIIVLLVVAAAIVTLRDWIKPIPHALARPRLTLALLTFFLGAYDGFFGPGTGSMLIIAFAIFLGDSLTRASGNAKIANLASNAAALVVFTFSKTVLWRVSIPMAVAGALGAHFGARLALRGGDRFVRLAVLFVVACLIVKIGHDLVRR